MTERGSGGPRSKVKSAGTGLRLLLANRSDLLPFGRTLVPTLRTRTISRWSVSVTARRDTFRAPLGPAIPAAHASFRAAWALRTHFVHRDFAVTVLVEFTQSLGGVLDFVLIDHTVMVRIKCGHERRDHRALSCPTGTAGVISAGPIRVRRFTWAHVASGRTLATLRARLI